MVVAAHNEERWIGRSLASLRAQTHPPEELILADDGSTDRTAQIARHYDARVLTLPHRGAGAARDVGACAASGDVIVFLDADDVYAPDFIERLIAPLSDPAVEGTFPGGIAWLNPDERLAPGWLRMRGFSAGVVPDYGQVHPWPKAVCRSALERAGGYPHVGYGEDLYFGHRVGPAVVVPDARWRASVPSGPVEVARHARWIGRGPRFEREHPPLWRLVPPASLAFAAAWLARGEARTAAAKVLYDAGRLVGFLESRLRPSLRAVR